MPKIHTHLHLALLLQKKMKIANEHSFLLGTVYPDCFHVSVEKAKLLHYMIEDNCDLSKFIQNKKWNYFTFGYYFHLWVDNYIQKMDLNNITVSDCLLCDMEVIAPILQELLNVKYEGKEKEAQDNLTQLEKIPMPLYLVDEEKKKKYNLLLNEINEQFIKEMKRTKKMNFKEMRRKKQELTLEETQAIFERGTSGTLALLDEQGYPYAVPMSYIIDCGKLYFHSAKVGHKIEAILHHNKASFCVIDQDEIIAEKYTTYYRSAIAFGKIQIIEDEQLKYEVIQKLVYKYSSDYQMGIQNEINQGFSSLCMIQFEIETMSGKEAIELVKRKK